MAVIVMYASLLVCAGTLAWGYAQAGWAVPAWALAGTGLLWTVALVKRWHWSAGVGLLIAVAAAGAGLWLALPPGWMIAGALAGLVNWDLADFTYRMRLSAEGDESRALERGHLARLAILVLVGLVLASGAMLLRLQFSFEWAIFLVLAAAWGVTQLVSWLRKSPE